MSELSRIALPQRATLETDFIARSRPAIITGGMTRWRALSTWDEGYLRDSSVGERVVPVEHYPRGNRFEFPLWDYRPMRDMTLREYVELTSSDPARYYLADQEVRSHLPELWGDIEVPPLFDTGALQKAGIFLGRDTIDAAHCHPDTQVLVCQVKGRRRVSLFEPRDGRFLSPAPWYCPNFNWSTIDFDAIDRARAPDLHRARRIDCVIEPGEMLFIPVQWWCLMHGDGFNASVCFLWTAHLSNWPFPMPGLRVIAAGAVSLGVVRPMLPLIRRWMAAEQGG